MILQCTCKGDIDPAALIGQIIAAGAQCIKSTWHRKAGGRRGSWRELTLELDGAEMMSFSEEENIWS